MPEGAEGMKRHIKVRLCEFQIQVENLDFSKFPVGNDE